MGNGSTDGNDSEAGTSSSNDCDNKNFRGLSKSDSNVGQVTV